MRKRGHLADHPEVVRRRAGILHHASPARAEVLARMQGQNLPLQTTNLANLSAAKGGPGVVDQDGVGGCEGCAWASAGTLRQANLGVSRGRISEAASYLGALMQDRSVQADGTLSPTADSGTMPSSVIAAWAAFGAMLAADDPQCPMSTGTMYVNPGDQNGESGMVLPTLEKLHQSAAYRLVGAYFVQSTGTQRLLEALATLATGRTMTNAIPASGAEFQNYAGGVLGALSGPVDHANHVADYCWTGTAADFATFVGALQQGNATLAQVLAQYLVLDCVNSWGLQWGEANAVAGVSGGTYRANKDYFDQCEDLAVAEVTPAS